MAIYSGFSHWKWWFSIAMLVYQRVSCFACIYTYICAIQWHEWHWQEPGFQTKLPGCRRMVMGLPRIARNWLQFGKNDKEPCSFDVPSILDTSIFTEFIHKNIYIIFSFIYLFTYAFAETTRYIYMVHVMFLWCCLSYAFHFAKLSSHRQRLEQREKAVSEPQKRGWWELMVYQQFLDWFCRYL